MQISKSRYMAGRQCPRRLWQEIHYPERADDYGAATEFSFFQGHDVGALARSWRGDGVLIDVERGELDRAVAQTREAIKQGARRIYEAAFKYQGFLALADVIEKKNDGSWRLIEVKATTAAKDIHVPDLAFQAWLMTRNGLLVSETAVMHLDSSVCWPEIPLTLTGNTREVLSLVPEVARQAKQFARLIDTRTEPDNSPGRQCQDPYPCNFQSYCWRDVPADHLGVIPRLSEKKQAELEKRGWTRVGQIKDLSLLSVGQRRWVSTINSGEPYVDEAAIRQWLGGLHWPVFSLDFETIAYAIPRWDGVRPYQQIPFQFSCHRQGPRGARRHREYLHLGQDDPRKALVAHLIEAVEDSGSIIAWNAGFERRVIVELAEKFPRQRTALMRIAERLVDLMDVFRQWYLHPDCLGSSSIKAVAPAVLGRDYYDELAVSSGDEAYAAWHLRVFGQGDASLEQGLREYCQLDTLLPLELLNFIRQQVRG